MDTHIKIAFGYKARSGKDTAREYLEKRYRVHTIRFAGALYDIMNYAQKRVGITQHKDSAMMQLVGQGFRDRYGPGVWVNAALSDYVRALESDLGKPQCDRIEIAAVADMRYRQEADTLRAMGFYLVKIDRPNRPIDRDPNHSSEIDLDGYDFDETVENTGTIEEFETKIQQLVDRLRAVQKK
jgi:hypothetical protein